VHDDNWQSRAACRGADIELFYSIDEADQRQALSFCARCDVRVECFEQAMAARETFGTWGGTIEGQRRRVFRAERRGRRTTPVTARGGVEKDSSTAA
jgi:WhiB family redox-sensing transcriptional regulator